MKAKKHALLAAATTLAALAALALTTATATAITITPSPYVFRTDTGSIRSTTVLGNAACNLSNVSGTLTDNGATGSGSITGATVNGCQGLIVSGGPLPPPQEPKITITLNAAGLIQFDVLFHWLETNILGGRCLYAGTLTGTSAVLTNTMNVAGVLALAINLNGGFCHSTLNFQWIHIFVGAMILLP